MIKKLLKVYFYTLIGVFISMTVFGFVFPRIVGGATVCFPYQGCTGTSEVPASGTIPIGTGGGVYTPKNLTAGSNISITNASGSVTITGIGGGSFNATGTATELLIFTSTSTGTSSANMTFSTTSLLLTVAGSSSFQTVSSTNLTASGYIVGASLNTSGQSALASVSSTNLLATGYLTVSGQTTLGAVSSTNLRASGYLTVVGQTTFASASGTNLTASGYLQGANGYITNVSSTNIDLTGRITLDDNQKAKFGTGNDATVYYNGTNLIIDPREVGTGNITIGSGAAGVDYEIAVDGETNNGLLIYDEDNDRWTFFIDTISVIAGAGNSDVTAATFNISNSQTTTTNAFTSIGVSTFCNWAPAVSSGACIGGDFRSRLDVSNRTSPGSTPGLIGGKFSVVINGEYVSSSISARGGVFQVTLDGGTDVTYPNATVLDIESWGIGGGTRNEIGTLVGIEVRAPNKVASGKVTNLYGIRVGNIGSVAVSSTLQAVQISTQTGTATSSNLYLQGGDLTTGHIEFAQGSIWSTASTVRLKGGAGSTIQGTGDYTFQVGTSTVNVSSTLKITQDAHITTSTKGFVLQDIDGVCWRMAVSTSGVLSTASTTCP